MKQSNRKLTRMHFDALGFILNYIRMFDPKAYVVNDGEPTIHYRVYDGSHVLVAGKYGNKRMVMSYQNKQLTKTECKVICHELGHCWGQL